ncbi:MAG: M23 family metallopeptidase [Kofleriaceae bacterium]|nr:M23 family metallopeptidase [Kofleriaceae bacterium]
MWLASGCAEPLAISSFDSKIGVNWLVRPTRHRGVDYVAAKGSPVLAAQSGIVIRVYLKPKVGWIVRIAGNQGTWHTRYLHLDSASVALGQRVERGQEIGKVGIFHHSAGVEHVHLELYGLNHSTPAKPGSLLLNPNAKMAGCFDTNRSYNSTQLTIPIPCQDSWFDATRPVESNITGTEVAFEYTGLDVDSIGLRTRGIMPSSVRLADFSLYLGWDASAGYTSDKKLRYDTRAVSGLGIAHGLFDLALLSGFGHSKVDGVLDSASYIPATLFLQVKQRRLWVQAWARSAWVLGSSPRNQPGADEFALGAQIRLPPLTKLATTLSVEYQKLQTQSILSFTIGVSLDSFLSAK